MKKEVIRYLMRLHPHLNRYHIDSKKKGDYSLLDGHMILSETPPDPITTTGSSIVWQPINESIKAYDKFFTSILDAGLPCIVDIDEIVNMVFGQGNIPRGLSILLSQGRKPGMHVMGGMQKVVKSPKDFIGQSTYIVSFFMQRAEDRRPVASELDIDPNMIKELKKYEYLAANMDKHIVKKFKDVPGEPSKVLSIL